MEVADRIEVLRLGVRVARFRRGEASGEQLVAAMTGALVQECGSMSRAIEAARGRVSGAADEVPYGGCACRPPCIWGSL